jgi:hypothetical protein
MSGNVTAFFEGRIVARGSPAAVTRTIEQGWPADQGAVRVFDDRSGRAVDLDLWDAGRSAAATTRDAAPSRGRGRPKLGVIAREVTLLPRHWAWLAEQPGGASAAIRRLVEAARKGANGPGLRAGRDAAYHFLTDVAGDRPGYEEAMRALYRGETERFRALIAAWPGDVAGYAEALLAQAGEASE